MNTIRLTDLLFDLDGTLTDPKTGITRCIQHALLELGHEPPEADALEWCIGPPLVYSFARLMPGSDGQQIHQAVLLYRERYSAVGLYENRVYEGIPEMLQALQSRGFRLFLATAKPRIFAERILHHFNLNGSFTRIFGAELDGQFTDKPSLIRHILEQTDTSASQALMIGDRRYDLEGGRANGMRTAAVTYGYGSEEELRQAGADLFFHAPQQIQNSLMHCFQDKSV